MQRRHFLMMSAALAADWALLTRVSLAQTYPAQPIRLVVPFPAGSATDNIARVVAQGMQADLGQSVIVENRPGAQAMLGADAVARSEADGYTILVTAVSFAATPAMFKNPSFDPVADFTPISRIATTPLALMVRADFPARTLAEFLEHVRSQPGKLSAGYGSSSSQVCIAHLASLGGLDVLPVPYKGIPLAINDLLGGTVDFTFADLGNAMAQAKGGRLRALAVTSAERTPLMPDWPTIAETLPGFDIDAWIAVLGPKDLPDAVVQRLHDALAKTVAKDDVRTTLAGQGFAPAMLNPAQTQPFLKTEVEKWTNLSKLAGIEPQ